MRGLFLLILLAVVGCNTVSVDKPFGEPVSDALVKRLKGRWLADEDDIIAIEPVGDSELVAGQLSWREQEKTFEAESVPVSLRQIDGKLLLFAGSRSGTRDPDEKLGFVWLSKMELDDLRIRVPEPKAFRKAVEAGQLDGKIESKNNGNFTVALTAEDCAQKLGDLDWETLFSQEAGRLRRVIAAEMPRIEAE